MLKENEAPVVNSGADKELQIFTRVSYQNQLALVTAEADKSFKRVYKKVDKIVKRKRKEYLKAQKPGKITGTFKYVGRNFVLPIVVGACVGAIAGVLTDVGTFLAMAKTATLGDISAVFRMTIQGAMSVGLVRAAIEVVKVPWKSLGLGQENHPNRFINIINGIINFVPRVIKQLSPKKEEESVEDYFQILENDPSSRKFMEDPETKARLYILYSLKNYTVEKPKIYNYKLLHAIKGGVKYAIVGGLLSIFNPLESVYPIWTSIAAISGAISEFVYKRSEEKAFKNQVRQNNADHKIITKKTDENSKNQLIGCLVNRWFGGTPDASTGTDVDADTEAGADSVAGTDSAADTQLS